MILVIGKIELQNCLEDIDSFDFGFLSTELDIQAILFHLVHFAFERIVKWFIGFPIFGFCFGHRSFQRCLHETTGAL